jgi:hypothetical protein
MLQTCATTRTSLQLPLLHRYVKYTQPALNGSKIKHYISEMKVDIKLCTSSFSVVILPGFFLVKLFF